MRRSVIRGLAISAVAACIATGLLFALSGDWLRVEVEDLLSELLRGRVTAQSVQLHWTRERGLRLEGESVSAWPSPRGPGLSARRASGRIHLPSLLIGRVRLSELVLEDVHGRIQRGGDGRLRPEPLEQLGQETERGGSTFGEPAAAWAEAVERLVRTVLEGPVVARSVVVTGGLLEIVDEAPGLPDPVRFQLERIEGSLTRPLLGEGARLELKAVIEDPAGPRVPIRIDARRTTAGSLRVALTVSSFPLPVVEGWARQISEDVSLPGLLTGTIEIETSKPHHARFELDCTVRDFAPTIPLRGEAVRIDLPIGYLRARIDVQPERIHLVHAEASGARLDIDLSGAIERPASAESVARLRADLRGGTVEDVASIVSQLPEADRAALEGWFDRLESGEVERFSLTGAAPVSRWRKLARGELAELPRGFLVGFEIADFTARIDEDDVITDLGLVAEWSGDRIEISDANARWDGVPLPQMHIVVQGVRELLRAGDDGRTLRTRAEPMPGLPLLLELVLGDDATQDEVPRATLRVETLRHPLVRWPIEGAVVRIEPTAGGAALSISEGTWAGVPFRGELVYLTDPPRVDIHLSSHAKVDEDALPLAEFREAMPGAPWATGTFRLDAAEAGGLAIVRPSGRFAVAGSVLELSSVGAELQVGLATGAARVDLALADALGLSLELHVREGELAEIGPAVGLPEDLARGAIDLDVALEGRVRAEAPLLSGLSGRIALTASEGELLTQRPVAVGIAQATEDFNPFATGESMRFDWMGGDFVLEQGVLRTENFRVEGPVRVFASGTLDLREEESSIDAVVGVFLFRQLDQVLDIVPLVKRVMPGSDRGVVGAYYEVKGPTTDPEIHVLTMKSIAEGLPDILTMPFEALASLFDREEREEREERSERPTVAEARP